MKEKSFKILKSKIIIGLFVVFFLVSLAVTGCMYSRDQVEEKGTKAESLIIHSQKLIELLRDKKIEEFSKYIHPTKGIRFSPYAYIDVDKDLIFQTQEIVELWKGSEKYTWGAYDGSGFPIELTLQEYYEQFIYDVDFVNPQMIGNNTVIGKGTTVNNIAEAYPDGVFIEYHFDHIDPQYAGIDWRSLRLVFEKIEDAYYVVGIVHDQWTI
ncbi:MAG: hypothetical protein GX238_12170 [Epulopiscium sp.]|nr:hypothetical protein [Candidatus Epulonipiscium sp.]